MKRDSFALVRLLAARFFRQAQRHCYNRVRRAFRMAQLGVHTSTSLTGSIVRSWLAYHPGIRNSAVVRPRYSRRPRLLLGRARAQSLRTAWRGRQIFPFPQATLFPPDSIHRTSRLFLTESTSRQSRRTSCAGQMYSVSQLSLFLPLFPLLFSSSSCSPPEHGSI